MANEQEVVLSRVREIAAIALGEDDGVEFLVETLTSQVIREDNLYAGVRLSMSCTIAATEVKLKLDVNFGDPVTPGARRILLPSQRPGVSAVPVLGYPVETVIAEKASTAIALGEANTRVRDYVDLYTLTRNHALDYVSVREALEATTTHRQVELIPLAEAVGSLSVLRASTSGPSASDWGRTGRTCRRTSPRSLRLSLSLSIRWWAVDPPEARGRRPRAG